MTAPQAKNILDEALSFLNFDKIPSTMKELNRKYRQMALCLHPDKNGGTSEATENYQNLLKCYRIIGDEIIENGSNTNENTDDEEKDNVALFKNFNFDQKNKLSHTIFLEKECVSAWRKVLTSKCGEPQDLTQKNHGLKFQVLNFIVNDETFTITVTLWETTKENEPKLHIQSSKQFANDMFIMENLPEYYSEVRKITPISLADVGARVFNFGAGAGASARVENSGANSGRNLRSRNRGRNLETIRNELKEQVKELRNDALKKSLDIQRNLLVENCLEEEDMDVGNTETEEIEVTPPVTGPQTFSFSDIQVNYLEIKDENAKLKENLEEKENFILELEKKKS